MSLIFWILDSCKSVWSISFALDYAAGTFTFHNSRIGVQFIGRNDENYGPDFPLFHQFISTLVINDWIDEFLMDSTQNGP